MNIACCVWAIDEPEVEMLRSVRDLGFKWIDIQPTQLKTLESRLLAQELGLQVSCVGASFGMPGGAALDHAKAESRRIAHDHVTSAIEKAARMGANIVYVVPGVDKSPLALERFADSLVQLADIALAVDVKLAVEHFPGKALPTAADTLEFIREAGHANLYLLYDSGHIQISCEDPTAVIENAGDRLGYVHFDDNDGVDDLHWSLLQGVMTQESLRLTLKALAAVDYRGAVSLELHPGLPRLSQSLAESKDALLRATYI